jgi:hypothetical protein
VVHGGSSLAHLRYTYLQRAEAMGKPYNLTPAHMLQMHLSQGARTAATSLQGTLTAVLAHAQMMQAQAAGAGAGQ